MRTTIGIIAAGLLLAGHARTAAAGEPVDCSIREDRFSDRDDTGALVWSQCLRASSRTGCIAAADVAANGKCLDLDANAVLCDEAGGFDMTVYLTTDDVDLDCAGQFIDHRGRGGKSGIRAPYEHSVSNIAIRHCMLRDIGKIGIELKRFFRGDELDGPMRGHEQIRIEDSLIDGTGWGGIYVGQNAMGTRIDNVVVSETELGIYLEAGSTYTHITHAVVMNTTWREAIAVDSSAHNVIENSTFRDNAAQAIMLYKNCGEPNGQVCPIRRELNAAYNEIRDNDFYDGNDVVVASRQFKLYGPDRCAGIDLLGYWQDHADHNAIVGNAFHPGAVLDVQDGPTAVVDNRFDDTLFELGTGHPLFDPAVTMTGSIVADNRFDHDAWLGTEGSPSDALDGVVFYNNRTDAGACMDEVWLGGMCQVLDQPGWTERYTEYGCFLGPIELDGDICGRPRVGLFEQFATGSWFEYQDLAEDDVAPPDEPDRPSVGDLGGGGFGRVGTTVGTTTM